MFAVLPAMFVPLLGALIYFVAYSGETWAQATYVLVKAYTLIWPFVATAFILRERIPWPDLGASRHRRAVLPGLVVGGLLSAAGLALMHTSLGDAVMANADQVRLKVTQLGVADHYLAFALFLSFLHSGMEEIYWRWFVFGTLNRLLSFQAAAILGSLAFASHHVVILSQYFPWPLASAFGLAVAIGGYLWCWMYRRQGTLTGAWVSHILLDLAILWVGYRMIS